jgi:hypothetical protein
LAPKQNLAGVFGTCNISIAQFVPWVVLLRAGGGAATRPC